MMRAWSRYGAMLALLVLSAPGLAQGWWDTDWTHRVRGYIDATHVDEAIPVVPMWVPSTATAWYTAVQADGDDVRVVADDGTVLDYYLVAINTGTPVCMLLVNVTPVISTSVDGYLSIYAGNALASAASSGSAVFTGTDYEGYWMPGMSDDDFTGNGFGLTGVNWSRSTDVAASDWPGLMAATYNGTDQYHWDDAAPTASLPAQLEALVYSNDVTGQRVVVALGSSSTNNPIGMLTTNTGVYESAWRGTASGVTTAADRTRTHSQWDQVFSSRNALTSGESRVYVNAATRNNTGNLSTGFAVDRVAIGALVRASASNYASANVAQAAVSSVVRSANFVATNHKAWFTADFIVWGSVEEAPTGGAGHAWFYMRRN